MCSNRLQAQNDPALTKTDPALDKSDPALDKSDPASDSEVLIVHRPNRPCSQTATAEIALERTILHPTKATSHSTLPVLLGRENLHAYALFGIPTPRFLCMVLSAVTAGSLGGDMDKPLSDRERKRIDRFGGHGPTAAAAPSPPSCPPPWPAPVPSRPGAMA